MVGKISFIFIINQKQFSKDIGLILGAKRMFLYRSRSKRDSFRVRYMWIRVRYLDAKKSLLLQLCQFCWKYLFTLNLAIVSTQNIHQVISPALSTLPYKAIISAASVWIVWIGPLKFVADLYTPCSWIWIFTGPGFSQKTFWSCLARCVITMRFLITKFNL